MEKLMDRAIDKVSGAIEKAIGLGWNFDWSQGLTYGWLDDQFNLQYITIPTPAVIALFAICVAILLCMCCCLLKKCCCGNKRGQVYGTPLIITGVPEDRARLI